MLIFQVESVAFISRLECRVDFAQIRSFFFCNTAWTRRLVGFHFSYSHPAAWFCGCHLYWQDLYSLFSKPSLHYIQFLYRSRHFVGKINPVVTISCIEFNKNILRRQMQVSSNIVQFVFFCCDHFFFYEPLVVKMVKMSFLELRSQTTPLKILTSIIFFVMQGANSRMLIKSRDITKLNLLLSLRTWVYT